MRRKELLIVVMLLLIPSVWHVAFAQSGDFSFTADRPGVATGTDVLNKGLFQWEVGAAYDRTDNDDAVMHGYTFCNSLFRYGLTNTAELRLELNGVYEHSKGSDRTGLAPVIVGTKVKLYDSDNWLPTTSLLATLALPLGTKGFRPNNVAPSLYLLFANNLTEKLCLDYNVGLEWDGEDAGQTVFAAACLGYSFNDTFGAFVESYNYFPRHGKAEWNADCGVTVQVAPRVQLDLSGAMNLNHIGDMYGVSLGVAWTF